MAALNTSMWALTLAASGADGSISVGLERFPRLWQPAGGLEAVAEREVEARFRRGQADGLFELRDGSLGVARALHRQRQIELRGVIVREQPGRFPVLVDGTRPVPLTPGRCARLK